MSVLIDQVGQILFIRMTKYLPPLLLTLFLNHRLKRYIPNKINMANYGVPAHSKLPIYPFMIVDDMQSLLAKGKVLVRGTVSGMAEDSVLLQTGERITGEKWKDI